MLTPKQFAALKEIDTPTICNAIEPFEVRRDSEGFMGWNIRCQFPDLGVMLGYAVTATVDSMTPSRELSRAPMLRLWEGGCGRSEAGRAGVQGHLAAPTRTPATAAT